ncbi:MAG TPA: VIT domain-containing protein [Abditibacterium sp.]
MRKWPLLLAATTASSAVWVAHSLAQPNLQPTVPSPSLRDSGEFFPRPILPRRPHPVFGNVLQLESQKAQINVRGPLAKTHLRQTLRNPADRVQEGTYLFALPRGAAVSNFAMTMGGKRLEAEILEGDKAREIYTDIVQKMRDPAILEFLDRDLVRARIFPVPARGIVEIEIDYAQTVENNRLALPLRAPETSEKSVTSTVQVAFEDRDVRSIYSPSHPVETRREGEKTVISAESSTTDRDFSLLWTRGSGKVSLDLLTFQPAGEDGYFLLLAAPDPAIAAKEIDAKDVVFVFDTSGSMEGVKIEQARRALKTLLGSLGPRDRFNVVTFASGVRNFRDGLVSASQSNIDAARSFADEIKAIGGTNISDALASALKMTANTKAPQIVFMTDGQPTVGQTSIDAILKDTGSQNASQARLFTFGVGNDVNARLLDALAEDHRGASDYVLPQEDIEVKVGALYQKIAFPVLSDAQIDFGTLGAYDVYPPRLPDLFRGSQAAVFGRFRGQPGKIMLMGAAGGQKVNFNGAISALGTPETPKLWATRKVGYLIDDARRAGRPLNPEVREEVIKLSQKYGIVTPLTAALITEDGAPRRLQRLESAPFLGDLRLSPKRASAPVAAPGGRIAESGASGVYASQQNKILRDGRDEDSEIVKTIEGKTFTLVNRIWTDNSLNSQQLAGPKRTITFASREYFDLLRDPKLAKWLSVGDRVIMGWKGTVLEIKN